MDMIRIISNVLEARELFDLHSVEYIKSHKLVVY